VKAVVRRLGMVALLVLGAARGDADEINGIASNGSNGFGYPVVEIWKAQRKMQVRQGDTLLGEYRVTLGQDPRRGKELRGDGRTPVGRYHVSDKNPASRFHRFLGISYPNAEDAERGYRRGLLNAGQWADIFLADMRGVAPPPYTAMGGRVGIHGFGGRPYVPVDWTEGCIAVSDDEIEVIYDRVPVGAPVIIHE
jgi:murein L,D-transpeptidase YafK